MSFPHRARLSLLGALALPILLSGCGGTPFGEALSRGFSPSGAEIPALSPSSAVTPAGGPSSAEGSRTPNPAPPPSVPGSAPSTATRPPEPAPPKLPTATGKPSPVPGPRGAAATPALAGPGSRPSAAAPSNPVPYRVTLRLPTADPAAPAEVVTQALRAAGVPFEVETIERLPRSGPTAPSPSAAAAAPPASQPPAARPAPAPR